MSDVVPLRKRGTWQGLQSIMFAVGSSAGAPLGGLLTDTIGWRWSFLIQVPITLFAIITVALALRVPPSSSQASPSSETILTKIKRIDFLGALTLILATTALLLGLDRGSTGTAAAWSDPFTITSLVLSLLFALAFLYTEWHIAAEPFAPHAIMAHPSLLANYAINFFSTASMMALTYQLPFYLQAVRAFSPSKTGLWMVPGVIGGVGGSIVGGASIQRTGRYWWVLVAGYVVMTAGTVVITLSTGILWFSGVAILIGKWWYPHYLRER